MKHSAIQKTLPASSSDSSIKIVEEKKDANDEKKEVDEKKKPEWLEELSRKQAHRKSGLFTDTKIENTNPQPSTQPKPVALTDKPHLPVKPSQIRDDGNWKYPQTFHTFSTLIFTFFQLASRWFFKKGILPPKKKS